MPAMRDLPASIGMLPFRRLVPIMAALAGQVNALTAEAVAAAIALDGAVHVDQGRNPGPATLLKGDSAHVTTLGLEAATDEDVWDQAG